MRSSTMLVWRLLFLCCFQRTSANSTEYWIARREALIDSVFGYGPGVLSNRSIPDHIATWPEDPEVQGIVWNMTTEFEITSTVFFSPVEAGRRSEHAFFFHHGHSDCRCPGVGAVSIAKCRPGCNSSMPSGPEDNMLGYSWWDLYNVSGYFHALGYDVFIFSMPLKGINVGPGSTNETLNYNHWWFLQWEMKGDHALRYFIEPVVLTANYAKAQGYSDIYMAGLSGGGWSTTLAPAIDKRIVASFPIAGSVPCAMRNPTGLMPNQSWTGNDDEDFEQSCMPHKHSFGPGDDKPGRPAFAACNYTCMYLLAGLEPHRFQVQILHEFDNCCFSPHGRHNQMLQYEANIRSELMADDRKASLPSDPAKHGWFTSTSTNHVKHEVCVQDKAVIAAAMVGKFSPSSKMWQELPCDILHTKLPDKCGADREPGFPAHEPASQLGYVLLGHGSCQDSAGLHPAWGQVTTEFGNQECKERCDNDETCDAYMSSDWNATSQNLLCRFYCTRGVGGLCGSKGNGGGMPTTTDRGDLLQYCWRKTEWVNTYV